MNNSWIYISSPQSSSADAPLAQSITNQTNQITIEGVVVNVTVSGDRIQFRIDPDNNTTTDWILPLLNNNSFYVKISDGQETANNLIKFRFVNTQTGTIITNNDFLTSTLPVN